MFVFAYFFNPELSTLILNGLEEPVPALLLSCKRCREQVQLSWACAAALGARNTSLVSAFPFSSLPSSGRMTSFPLLQIAPLLC